MTQTRHDSLHRQYQDGMNAFREGRYAEAIEQLKPLAASPVGATGLLSRYYLAQAHYRYGVQLFEARRYRDALTHLQVAARTNPHGGNLAEYLAACHAHTGQYEQASQYYETLTREAPAKVSLRIRLALTQHQAGRPIEAMTTLREAIREHPGNAELRYQLGVMAAAAEDYADAEGLFREALAIEPSHAPAHERLAQLCSLTSRHEQALRHLERAHQLDPYNLRVAWQLGLLAGPLAERFDNLRVRWSRPTAAPVRRDLDALGRIIIREPDFVEAMLALPESGMDQEVFSLMAATLERALEAHPDFADLHHHCSIAYRRMGRWDRATAHAEQAVRINPRYVNALIGLARCYEATDAWQPAAQRLEQAIAAGGDYPDVNYLLGRLYQNSGDLPRARKAYRRALELKSDYREAQQALAALIAAAPAGDRISTGKEAIREAHQTAADATGRFV